MTSLFLPLTLFFILTGAYLWVVWKFPPAIFLANITYSAITKIVSCLYLELTPVYMIEMGMWSSWTFGTVRQLVLQCFIWAGAICVLWARLPQFWNWSKGALIFSRPEDLNKVLLAAGALCALQFLNVLASPNIPILGGTTRQYFWNYDIRFPILRDFIGLLMAFVPCVASYGMGIGWAKNDKRIFRWSLALMVFYFVFLIVSGQKFNGLMVGVFLAVGPFYVIARASGRKIAITKWGIRGLVLLVIALSLGVVGFGERQIAQKQGSVASAVAYRAFAMQGAVYFTADRNAIEGRRASPAILYEGMDATINALTPAALAKRYIAVGVNLAGSLPANAIYAYGFWIAILICFAYGLIVGFGMAVIIRRILEGKVFQLFLLSYIYIWIISVYSRGSFEEMLTVKFAVFTLAVLALEYGTRKGRGKRSMKYGYPHAMYRRPEIMSAHDRAGAG